MEDVASKSLGRIARWVPVVLYAALITWLSSQKGGGIPRWEFLRHDKIIHTLEYCGLGFLLARALQESWRRALGIAVVCGTLFGVVDEFHQSFVPGRQGNDPGDMAADFLGSSLGAGAYCLLRRTQRR